MSFVHVVAALSCISAMFAGSHIAHSQSYPARPVRIVAVEAGGMADLVARMIAQGLSESLGQQVIVENRGAAGGAIAAQTVAKATPDGYSILQMGQQLWLLPFMRDDVQWDPIKDFSPITLVATAPGVLVVYPSLPVKSVKELIALAQAKPGELNYGIGGPGTIGHIAGELFKAMAHVNIVTVPYRGIAPGLLDVMSGRIQLSFPTSASVMPHVKSGKLTALAVTSAQPTSLVPGVPTVSATGLPGYEAIARHGIFVPVGTPTPIIILLNREIVRILNRTDVKERMFTAGVEAVGSAPENVSMMMKAEMARLGKVIKDVGIRAD